MRLHSFFVLLLVAACSGRDDGGGGGTDAGDLDIDAGPSDVDAGPSDVDSGPGGVDAGPMEGDAGPGDGDAGACAPRAADGPSRGMRCEPAGGPATCPEGYVCEAEVGIILNGSCQIPCTPGRDCECPGALTCQGFTDKAGTDYHCSE